MTVETYNCIKLLTPTISVNALTERIGYGLMVHIGRNTHIVNILIAGVIKVHIVCGIEVR